MMGIVSHPPVLGSPSLDHLIRLTDEVGIIQHATHDIPKRSTGYCTDDVARAFMAVIDAQEDFPLESERLQAIFLAFLHHAQLDDGKFHNFMSYDRKWLDLVGDGDANGRAIWAFGYGERYALGEGRREFCGALLDRALEGGTRLPELHSMSYAALGMTHSYIARGREDQCIAQALERIANRLLAALEQEGTATWRWFEGCLTYDNARLPEALMRIGAVLGNKVYIDVGFETLSFYQDIVMEGGKFVPIGSNGWYRLGQYRARYPQQPLEAAAMIDAASVAYFLSQQLCYRDLASIVYEWFLGNNSAACSLLIDGGCVDGIDEHGISKNQGAESTVSYLSAHYALRTFGRNVG